MTAETLKFFSIIVVHSLLLLSISLLAGCSGARFAECIVLDNPQNFCN